MLKSVFEKLADAVGARRVDLDALELMSTGVLAENDSETPTYTHYEARRGKAGTWSVAITTGIPNDQRIDMENLRWPCTVADNLSLDQAHDLLRKQEEAAPYGAHRQHMWCEGGDGGRVHYSKYSAAIAARQQAASLRVSAGRMMKMRGGGNRHA